MKKLLLITVTVFFVQMSNAQTVTDIDGNVYNTVTIGTQKWMKENLKTTKYSNGDAIATTSPATLNIMSESAPKYQWAYNGNDSIANIYGNLYTWFAASDNRKVCPTGWHIPALAEWKTLVSFLGGEIAALGKLREAGKAHWTDANSTNESGFTGLPAGSHWDDVFLELGISSHYWSTTSVNTEDAWRMQLSNKYEGSNTVFNSATKKIGWSVRCLNDTLIKTTSIDNTQNKIKISIHPNPTASMVTLSFGTTLVKEAIVKIYNLQSAQVFSKTFQNTPSATMDLTGNSAGIYFVKVIADGVNYEEKIVKE